MLWYGNEERPVSYTSHMARSQCSQINSEAKLSSFPVISEIAIISELYLN
jgi:hypothetical protein